MNVHGNDNVEQESSGDESARSRRSSRLARFWSWPADLKMDHINIVAAKYSLSKEFDVVR